MTQQLPMYEGEPYHNFVKHISNPLTMINYISRFKKYIEYCRVENIDDLLFNGDTKRIQMMISDFLIHTQGQGLSSATVSHYRTSGKFFYEMNDITALNWKKIAKGMKPFRRAANDWPYTSWRIWNEYKISTKFLFTKMNRKRCGEIIKPSAPLIREQFDKNNTEQAANPKNVKVGADRFRTSTVRSSSSITAASITHYLVHV